MDDISPFCGNYRHSLSSRCHSVLRRLLVLMVALLRTDVIGTSITFFSILLYFYVIAAYFGDGRLVRRKVRLCETLKHLKHRHCSETLRPIFTVTPAGCFCDLDNDVH